LGELTDAVRKFYVYFQDFLKADKKFRLLYLTSFGLFEKATTNCQQAINIFNEIVKINSRNGFAYRMLAYTYLDLQNWDESANNALLAYDNSRNDEDRFEAAKILSYNKYNNFLKAEKLFKALKSSKENKIKNECEKYFNCLAEIKKLKISDHETIQKFLLEKIRPKLVHLRSFISTASQNFKADLYEVLVHQQDHFTADYDELNSARQEFDQVEDLQIRSLFYRMLASSLRRKFENMEDFVTPDEIETLFKHSITLNDKDSFTHNYYGTFLKDIKEDYTAAEREYRKAIEIGDQSQNEFYHRHPKFLNDLALLIMKQVEKGLRDKSDYNEAKILLEEAVLKVKATKAKFNFPEENIKLLQELMRSDRSEL
jgi:tetratricopeptide (TPR) repeat protein